MPLHHQSKEKEIQKKRNIKLRKINERKEKMLVLTHLIIQSMTSIIQILLEDLRIPLY